MSTSSTVNQQQDEKASPRDWIQLTLTYVIMASVLLLCGWDLGWWQGWLYSVLLVVIGIGSRILAERKHPGIMAERGKLGKDQNVKPWDKILAPLMAVGITFPLFIVAGLDHRFGWSPEFPLWLNLLGFVLIIIGYAFATWALVENRFFSVMMRIQMERGHVVCDSGPYRFVRHPGYAGNILALPGIALALSSIWTLIPAIVAFAITMLRTRLEDRALQAELPGYKEYVGRVRNRLIPGIY